MSTPAIHEIYIDLVGTTTATLLAFPEVRKNLVVFSERNYLARGPYRDALQQLACIGRKETFTFLHQGEDPQRNTATALYEFLTELEAYCPRDNE